VNGSNVSPKPVALNKVVVGLLSGGYGFESRLRHPTHWFRLFTAFCVSRNAGVNPSIRRLQIPFTAFPVHYHLPAYHSMIYSVGLLTALFTKRKINKWKPLISSRCKQPTRCNKFRLLNFLNQLYMFRATNSPILRSTSWPYVQLLVQCTDIAADSRQLTRERVVMANYLTHVH